MAKEQFTPIELQHQGFKLGEFLPVGKAWDAKNDSTTNLGGLVFALAREFNRIESIIQLTNKELDLSFSEQLIREWELSVGIPDECFSISGTLAERRIQVVSKLRNVRFQTIQDYVDLAALFGIFAVVTPGLPEGATGTDKERRFSITVDLPGQFSGEIFPFPEFFPIPFTATITSLVQCLFEKIKPANVQMIIRYGQFGLISGTFNGTIKQLSSNFIGEVTLFFGSLAGDVGQLSGTIIAVLVPEGTLTGDVGQLEGSIIGGGVAFAGPLVGVIPQLTGSISGSSVGHTGTLTGDIGQLSGTINASISGLLWDDLAGNWDDLAGNWDDL